MSVEQTAVFYVIKCFIATGVACLLFAGPKGRFIFLIAKSGRKNKKCLLKTFCLFAHTWVTCNRCYFTHRVRFIFSPVLTDSFKQHPNNATRLFRKDHLLHIWLQTFHLASWGSRQCWSLFYHTTSSIGIQHRRKRCVCAIKLLGHHVFPQGVCPTITPALTKWVPVQLYHNKAFIPTWMGHLIRLFLRQLPHRLFDTKRSWLTWMILVWSQPLRR